MLYLSLRAVSLVSMIGDRLVSMALGGGEGGEAGNADEAPLRKKRKTKKRQHAPGKEKCTLLMRTLYSVHVFALHGILGGAIPF